MLHSVHHDIAIVRTLQKYYNTIPDDTLRESPLLFWSLSCSCVMIKAVDIDRDIDHLYVERAKS